MDWPMHGRTHPLIESWFTTENPACFDSLCFFGVCMFLWTFILHNCFHLVHCCSGFFSIFSTCCGSKICNEKETKSSVWSTSKVAKTESKTTEYQRTDAKSAIVRFSTTLGSVIAGFYCISKHFIHCSFFDISLLLILIFFDNCKKRLDSFR